MHFFFVLFVASATLVYSQQLPQQCAQIALHTSCINEAHQRVDQCGQNLKNGVPDLTFYDCQCKELTSIEKCFWYCNDSPEIMAKLPNEQANAKAWCDQATNMRKNMPITTSKSVPTSTIASTKSPTPTTSSGNGDGGSSVNNPTSTTSRKNYGPSSTLDLTSDAGSYMGSYMGLSSLKMCILAAFVIFYMY